MRSSDKNLQLVMKEEGIILSTCLLRLKCWLYSIQCGATPGVNSAGGSFLCSVNPEQTIEPPANVFAVDRNRTGPFQCLIPIIYLIQRSAYQGIADCLVLAESVRVVCILKSGDEGILY